MESWFTYKFRFTRPDSGGFRWWLDVLLFDTLVRDCLAAHGTTLTLWRIHRRAANDHTGHEFAFMCYGEADIGPRLDRFVGQHAALDFLRSARFLREFVRSEAGQAIDALSGTDWTAPLRVAWPYYIDGVSRMALRLLEELRVSPRPSLSERTLEECQTYYSELAARFGETWCQYGKHAFLHHINAVFGYLPVAVTGDQRMRF